MTGRPAVALLPVLAAVAGWLPAVGLPVTAVAIAACLVTLSWPSLRWWGPVTTVSGLVGLPVLAATLPGAAPSSLLPLLARMVRADIADRSMITADLPVTDPAACWTLTAVAWLAARATLVLTARGAMLPVRLGPALLLVAWAAAVAHPQHRLDPAVALVIGAGLLLNPLDDGNPVDDGRARRPGRDVLRRSLVAGLLVGLCGGGALAATAGRDLHQSDPAALVRDSTDPVSGADPLALAARWTTQSPEPAFDMAPVPDRAIRWAVLDRYDGLAWRAGSCPGERTGGGGDVYRISGNVLPGPWLPAPPGALASDAGQSCAGSGTVLTPDPAADYRVWSGDATRQAAVPAVAGVALTGAELSGRPPGPTDLQALAEQLRARSLDPAAVPGQQRDTLLAVARGDREGDRTQYAGAFALLAAAQGHPVRVVVGFTPSASVRTTDVLVWPEVWVDGTWQAFDPTPRRTRDGSSDPAALLRVQAPVAAPPAGQSTAGSGPATRAPAPGIDDPGPSRWGPLAAVTGSVLIAIGTAVFLARRRHRQADPAARICRAWSQVLAALTRHGPPETGSWPAMTPRQVAGAVPLTGGDLVRLAHLVTRTVYAEHPPSTRDAVDARLAASTIRRRIRQQRTRR